MKNVMKLITICLSLFAPVSAAQAEITVEQNKTQYTCNVDIFKEIYNNNFSYWAENMPGNWQGNPHSGMTDNNSDWQKKRMCLQVLIKEMAKSSNIKSVNTYIPNEYLITAEMIIDDDADVWKCEPGETVENGNCYTQPSRFVGTGGRFVVAWSHDNNVINDNDNCGSFYIPNTPGTSSYNASQYAFTLANGKKAYGYTGSCDNAISNLHYFYIEDGDDNHLYHDNNGSDHFTVSSITEYGMAQ